jgi:hypothetical protein
MDLIELDLIELTQRNLSAAIRETFNAFNSAERGREAVTPVGFPFVPESVTARILEARMYLSEAKKELDEFLRK